MLFVIVCYTVSISRTRMSQSGRLLPVAVRQRRGGSNAE